MFNDKEQIKFFFGRAIPDMPPEFHRSTFTFYSNGDYPRLNGWSLAYSTNPAEQKALSAAIKFEKDSITFNDKADRIEPVSPILPESSEGRGI